MRGYEGVMKRLSVVELRGALAKVPDWRRRGGMIWRVYIFDGFGAAMLFVNRVARLAERANHHPGIRIDWSRVTLEFTTHDAGGLTELDFELAGRCDAAAARVIGRRR
jgi:4a-hydroxytetrahydrobiopterin dehydratase